MRLIKTGSSFYTRFFKRFQNAGKGLGGERISENEFSNNGPFFHSGKRFSNFKLARLFCKGPNKKKCYGLVSIFSLIAWSSEDSVYAAD